MAQEANLTGRVLEKANLDPVAGASVRLLGSNLASVTNAEGRFLLKGVPTGIGADGPDRHAYFRAGHLHVHARAPGAAMRLDFHGMGGKRLSSSAYALPQRGWNRIRIAPAGEGVRLAWARILTAEGTTVYRIFRDAGLSASPWNSGVALEGHASPKRGSANQVEISVAGLKRKIVEAPDPRADLGDIVLDYPPRVLDVGAPPIYGAINLFDGNRDSSASRAEMEANWTSWKLPHPVRWQIMPDPAEPGNSRKRTLKTCCSLNIGEDDLLSKARFRDFQLHVEFNLPGHANSGVYLQNRYEIQIYPPHSADAVLANHDIGGLVGDHAPDTNVYRGFGRWQAFDVTFRSSRWNGPAKVEDARVTVYWNGIRIHDNVAAKGPATGGSSGVPIDSTLHGLKLQVEGGSDVRYRNIWIKRLEIKDPRTDFGY